MGNQELGKSKKRLYILIGLSVVGVVIGKFSFIFFFVGMLPAMVAYITDHDQNKYTSSTVAALNFSGVFPYLMDIYFQGGSFSAVASKLSYPLVWFVIYGSAAMGWAIVFFSPIIAAAVLDGIYSGRALHLEIQQKKLIEEWGEEVVGREKE
jgi:hypothetical protein